MSKSSRFDVLVVGGGTSGLSAALTLGRARRRVLLASDGPTRNSPAHEANNVFTRDGTPPKELVRIGREQLGRYDVTIRDERVVDLERRKRTFVATMKGGDEVRTNGVILACGVRDVLPRIRGLRKLWGKGVYHCPYCHGWEVAGEPLGIIGNGNVGFHLCLLIRGWTDDLILFTDGPSELTDEQRAGIERNGIHIREERIDRIRGGKGQVDEVVLKGGEVVRRTGLYISPGQKPASDLYRKLGVSRTEDGRVQADPFGRTSVPRFFVVGDAAVRPQSVIAAAASGSAAAAHLNMEMLQDEFQNRSRKRA